MPEIRFPNESPEYREARQSLLQAEAALREQTERVAALRRELPPGGEVPEDYVFQGWRDGSPAPVRMSELFGEGKDTLLVYGFMYGPKQKAPCPLCTSFLDGLEGQIDHLQARIAVAVVARSPIERIRAFADERGWNRLPLLSAADNDYPRHYHTESSEGSQLPMANVFVKRDGAVRHTWGSELLFVPNERGDARHIDILWPLWNVLDLTPGGRGDGYPKLRY